MIVVRRGTARPHCVIIKLMCQSGMFRCSCNIMGTR